MKISLFSFLVIIPFSHRTYCSTAGREFKNPNRLDMRQTCDHVGISNPTSITLLGQYSHFAHEKARAAERRSTRVRLHKAYKIKTDVALRNSELAVHSTQVQSLDPLESHRVFHVEICSSYEKMWSESLQMERE